MGVSDGLRDVAVAAGLAVWNLEQRAPAGQLEFGAAQIEGLREVAALARKIFIEFGR